MYNIVLNLSNVRLIFCEQKNIAKTIKSFVNKSKEKHKPVKLSSSSVSSNKKQWKMEHSDANLTNLLF